MDSREIDNVDLGGELGTLKPTGSGFRRQGRLTREKAGAESGSWELHASRHLGRSCKGDGL